MANSASKSQAPSSNQEQRLEQAAAAVSKAIAAEAAAQSNPGKSSSPDRPMAVTVLGAGVWGTALANLVRDNGHTVKVWSRRGALSLAEAIADADILVSAVSMKGIRETIAKLKALKLPAKTTLASASKGLDFETLNTPSQIWREAYPDHPLVVISGPNLSVEIEKGLPAACVCASLNAEAAEQVQEAFASDRFRVYTNDDPVGTELGGTLKNVIAIAVGICDGLELGTNAKSGLITRALIEIIRVGTHLGGQTETFFGLAGLGDLMATCSSPLSRNYRIGYGLAQGKSLAQITEELQSTAEGVNTAYALRKLAKREQIATPISRLVYCVLQGDLTPQQAVKALMSRDLKAEGLDLDLD
ncbi:MAG: NAD(P)H-dependent glycerol-3-phosphate dehydrogenase [Synechococcales cyanobacterium RM1_1_8]|nr:NAD(P)H-dependent glycerol-3-phosphate dehydrogenase [Synechococcales cyanobacterium RM1_1_8]